MVDIEADVSSGLPYFNMVGLLASEVREARERVRSAIKNIGETLPSGRITINLSPADRKKEGTAFDLPIAIALLCVMQRLDAKRFKDTLIVGELGLDGEIKKVRGILPIVAMAQNLGLKKCIIPYDNRQEGSVCDKVTLLAFQSLKELVDYYTEQPEGMSVNYLREVSLVSGKPDNLLQPERESEQDFLDICGQETVKRAIVVAVAGHHNLLMSGVPGVGKSMLASRIPDIMPPLSLEEKLEVSGIYSICGKLNASGLMEGRPFSAPHHTITTAALIGGGIIPVPGEITLAHRGVLFLDELPEFHQNVLDSLRQPLEEREVKLHRNKGSYIFPADCLLVAAMNPCKCGYYPDRNRCHCSEADVKRYQSRISGPLLDRIDMSIEVPRVKMEASSVLSTAQMREMVHRAVERQKDRNGGKNNSSLSIKELQNYCELDEESEDFIRQAYEKFEMSMRGYHKVLKIARTVADVEQSENININHLSEALTYRLMF